MTILPGNPASVGPEKAAPASNGSSVYWDGIAGEWQDATRAWRMLSDAVNVRLLERWLPPDHDGSVLKTDLFDEATDTGLIPWLSG